MQQGYCPNSSGQVNHVTQEAAYPDFTSFTGDLFQPEEIFQLDQPLRPEFPGVNNQDVTRSPPSLLDLGSGTIKYETVKPDQEQSYWSQLLSEDSSSSHLSISQTQDERLHFPGFEAQKESTVYPARRAPIDCYVTGKDVQEQNQCLHNPVGYTSQPRTQIMKDNGDVNGKSEHKNDQESYWIQPHDDRLHFPGFQHQKDSISSYSCARKSAVCFSLNKNDPQSHTLEDRPSQPTFPTVYQRNRIHKDVGQPLHGDPGNPGHSPVSEANPGFNGFESYHQIVEPHPLKISEEPFYYPGNDRCHYTCEVLDTRLPQMSAVMTTNGGGEQNVGFGDVPDLDIAPFVDYTFVGMLCSPTEEPSAHGSLPGVCNTQPTQAYVGHH